jgi:geranylgeranyl reductase family protein
MTDLPASDLPESCDVLVVGAGPAGSACAQRLAEGGRAVCLVDQHAFPREKVCGDGLIPDALQALRALGVLDEVMAQAQPVRHVTCIAPRGGRVDVPGTMAVLPRRTLDHILVRSAQRAGARLLPPARFEAPLVEAGQVVGARLVTASGVHEIRARQVILATGAATQAMLAAELCDRRSPSGIALRGYVRHEGLRERIATLQIVWHRRLAGGYGWIFPAPDGRYNIGAGYIGHRGEGAQNLRALFDAFCEVHADARDLVAGGSWDGELKGAPLRCSLTGARWSRPGLLATGEAIGSTYAFTGEGIGKAMAFGMLAAEAVLAGGGDDAIRARYADGLMGLKPQFDLYARAEAVNRHPWITDLVVWRARRSPRILRRMSGVLDETQNPGRILSWRGVGKLLFE